MAASCEVTSDGRHLNGDDLLGGPNLRPDMRRGSCGQNNNSLAASFERETEQIRTHIVPIKAKKGVVYTTGTPAPNIIEIYVPTNKTRE